MKIIDASGTAPSSGANRIQIDGDLYLDYSALTTRSGVLEVGRGEYLTLTSDLEIHMDADFSDMTPAHYATIEIGNQPLDLAISGNYLVYATNPVISTCFEVTGNIYVGDYARTAEVPVPPSFVLLLSAMTFFLMVVTRIFRRPLSGPA